MDKNLPRFRTYYNRPCVDEGITFDPNSSLTDQDFKMMTDVNYLLSHMAGHSRTPIYGVQDNSTFEDWQNEMAMLKRRYMALTPEMQKEFGNAQNFLNWCANPENYKDQLREVVEGRVSKENIERDNVSRSEKNIALAKSIAKAIKEQE